MSNEGSKIKVLLVDDDVGILNSLRRLLRKESWTLLTAENGELALALAEQHELDMVVSDARMPGMDGAQVLASIQQSQPDCVRVLMTGYADLATTVRAINEGSISRYVSKPWDDDELLLTLRQSLALRISERERKRLEKLMRQQNRELCELNNSLEHKVLARTSELQQTANTLELANAELKRSYVLSTQVFAAMLQQRLPRERQTNEAVIAISRAWAKQRELDTRAKDNLAIAAALYNIGKVTWEDRLLAKSADTIHKQDRNVYRAYPQVGEGFLMALEPMQSAGRIIRHHMECWDGTGFPDQLKAGQTPLEARMLRLVVDYVELQAGMLLDHKVKRNDALAWINFYSGKLYQPELAEDFIAFSDSLEAEVGALGEGAMQIDTRRAEPGMTLVRDLYAANGLLLLNTGKQLTRKLIDRLVTFELTENVSYVLTIRLSNRTAESSSSKEANA
jgi:response regulator RpfG family c-di-GMP phosphodiesterase